MSQVSRSRLNPEVYKHIFSIFHSVLIQVKNSKQADLLISDLLTPTEKIMIAKRLAIAYMLERNFDYQTISLTLKVSTATVASVRKNILQGHRGYTIFLKAIVSDDKLKMHFENMLFSIVQLPSQVSKGGGVYREIRKNILSKRSGI